MVNHCINENLQMQKCNFLIFFRVQIHHQCCTSDSSHSKILPEHQRQPEQNFDGIHGKIKPHTHATNQQPTSQTGKRQTARPDMHWLFFASKTPSPLSDSDITVCNFLSFFIFHQHNVPQMCSGVPIQFWRHLAAVGVFRNTHPKFFPHRL